MSDEILQLLRRDDKWFLGPGRAVIWAPEFPAALDEPGFWDHGCYYHLMLRYPMAVVVLDEQWQPIRFTARRRSWIPGLLQLYYNRTDGIELSEQRCVTGEDVLLSELQLLNRSRRKRRLSVVLVSCHSNVESPCPDAPDQRDALVGAYADRLAAGMRISCSRGGEPPYMHFDRLIGANIRASSFAVATSERLATGAMVRRRWHVWPFYEQHNRRGLRNSVVYRGGPRNSNENYLIFAAMHYRLDIAPGSSRTLVCGCAVAPNRTEALANLQRSVRRPQPVQHVIDEWKGFFARLPQLRCSQPYIHRAYWYRWYGLHLNTVLPTANGLRYPCVFEGINHSWFRHSISYSSQALVRDLRWIPEPTLAEGTLLNFFDHQARDGFIYGCLGRDRAIDKDAKVHIMYHCDWGSAVEAIYAVHGRDGFLQQVYRPLRRYARYMLRERDRRGEHLFDIVNQGETGQEYMSRYLFADRHADHWGPIRLKGIDATYYMYRLFDALAWIAEKLARPREATEWRRHEQLTAQAILQRMWHGRRKLFVDVHPRTGKKSPHLAAVGFYPFASPQLIQRKHLVAIREQLLNPKRFGTAWPAPSTSAEDDSFDPDGLWKSVRHNCPWNGRTWLMTNSHIAEAISASALHHDSNLLKPAARFIQRFIEMMFLDGDPTRPSSYEYYNPYNAAAPYFRGADDYMHSWLVDLIVKYVAGIQPQRDGQVLFRPLPFAIRSLSLDNVHIRGKTLTVELTARRRKMWIDGRAVRLGNDGAVLLA